VQEIRNKPSSHYTPEARQRTYNTHITHHHYSHDYNWYRGQPSVYVGGGYSSAFWWMMMEWDAQRRAEWLYHHRYSIDTSAYERGLQDGEVRRRIERLENERRYRDATYRDPEFNDDPSLMYDDDYVAAAYNPRVVHDTGGEDFLSWMVGIVLAIGVIALLGWGLYCLFFKVRIGS
jgi:hypothetical protein